MSDDYIYLSQGGFDRLKDELHQFKTVNRPKVIADIKRARELGDLSENAEYHAAKEAQEHLERKIGELEFKLSRAQVVKDIRHDPDTAALLSIVRVRDLDDGEEITYQLVSDAEADLVQDKISVASPVGKAMMGHRAGDQVNVETPGGKTSYEILEVRADTEGI